MTSLKNYFERLKEFCSPMIILEISSSSCSNGSAWFDLRKFRFRLMNIWVSNSAALPWAICRKLMNYFLLFLAAPSAILLGIDTAARRICETKPNFSSAGKFAVILYIPVTKLRDRFHTSKLWCGFPILIPPLQLVTFHSSLVTIYLSLVTITYHFSYILLFFCG